MNIFKLSPLILILIQASKRPLSSDDTETGSSPKRLRSLEDDSFEEAFEDILFDEADMNEPDLHLDFVQLIREADIETIEVALESEQLRVNEYIIFDKANDHLTPLMIAAYYGNADLCQFLLDHGADIGLQSLGDGKTAAAYATDPDVMVVLGLPDPRQNVCALPKKVINVDELTKGIDADSKAHAIKFLASVDNNAYGLDGNGDNIFNFALKSNLHFKLLRALKDYLVGPNADGKSSLHLVMEFMEESESIGITNWYNHLFRPVLDKMTKEQADVADNNGNTPLHLAVKYCCNQENERLKPRFTAQLCSIVETLVAKGCLGEGVSGLTEDAVAYIRQCPKLAGKTHLIEVLEWPGKLKLLKELRNDPNSYFSTLPGDVMDEHIIPRAAPRG